MSQSYAIFSVSCSIFEDIGKSYIFHLRYCNNNPFPSWTVPNGIRTGEFSIEIYESELYVIGPTMTFNIILAP